MSKFYDDARKWQLYVRHRRGRTLTQLQDETGITDKPLRAWFRAFDAQLSCPDNQDLLQLQQELRALREQHRQTAAELKAVRTIVQQALPEFHPLSGRLPLDSRLWSQPDLPTFRHPQIQLLLPHPASSRQNPEPSSGTKCCARWWKNSTCAPASGFPPRQSGRSCWARGSPSASGRFFPSCGNGRQTREPLLPECLRAGGPAPLLPSQSAGPPVQIRRPRTRPGVSDITELHYAGASSTCALCWTYSPARSWQPGPPARMTPPWWPGPLRPPFSGEDGPASCSFHSDQGRQYTSDYFRELLEEFSVRQSFSAPGVPYDNAVMESFFASLKKEEYHRYFYKSIGALLDSLQQYLLFLQPAAPPQPVGIPNTGGDGTAV